MNAKLAKLASSDGLLATQHPILGNRDVFITLTS